MDAGLTDSTHFRLSLLHTRASALTFCLFACPCFLSLSACVIGWLVLLSLVGTVNLLALLPLSAPCLPAFSRTF